MDKQFDESQLSRDSLAKKIVGEIVMSDSPEKVMKKWRSLFNIMQKDLAGKLRITPSVISDYESGRRGSPGIRVVRNYVNAMLDIDEMRGGVTIRTFTKTGQNNGMSGAILGIKEFHGGMKLSDFCSRIEASPITSMDNTKEIYGYTIIDSVRAVSEMSTPELVKLYGLTTQRALIFTKVSTGRTPMVAIKLTNLRPGIVVLHGLGAVDDVAKKIAEVEGIPLAVCRLESEARILEKLKEF